MTSPAASPLPSLHRFLDDRSGATAIEYSLIAAGIAGAIIAAVTGLGDKVLDTWNYVSAQVQGS